MSAAYFDCFSGISGDMTVGALLDLGVPMEAIEKQLSKIPLPPYKLRADKTTRRGISAVKFRVEAEEWTAKTWPGIERLLESSALDPPTKKLSLAIFRRLAEAEAKVHGETLDKVHFHEVGAVDAVIDIVCASAAFNALGITSARGSTVAVGGGTIESRHGRLPVPVPAVCELLSGVPVYSSTAKSELVTPTGAAILTELADSFGEIPPAVIEKTGYGAGERDLEHPNVLRIILYRETREENDVALVEATIDTADGEQLGYLIERILDSGAIDAWFAPVYMKKGRPGVILSALVPAGKEEAAASLLLEEGVTLGVRYSRTSRIVADREIVEVKTAWGTARAKIGRYKGKVVSVRAELEDCRRLALESGVSLEEIRSGIVREAKRLVDRA
ncbi:MAG: nickel pincer cofactor biosynthesis protein LarC [Candidatus Aquicultorales bacterium]